MNLTDQKSVYYCITYSDGIKEFKNDVIPANMVNEDFKDNLTWSQPNVRNVVVFNSREQWEASKNM